MKLAKQMKRIYCHNTPKKSEHCLLSVMGEDNPKKYMAAFQNLELRAAVRSVPAPIILVNTHKTLYLETHVELLTRLAQEKQRTLQSKSEEKSDEEEGEEDEDEFAKVKQKKKAKGPNPLSVMKKRKVCYATFFNYFLLTSII